MIETPTLFILGAGASKPYNYPIGSELRHDIIKKSLGGFSDLQDIRNNPNIPRQAEEIRRHLERFIEHFDKSYLKSIDKYLSLNPLDSFVGKFAITLIILRYEMASLFREEIQNPKEDWYAYLLDRMTSSFNKPEDYEHYCENKIAFITFNYDRSLEYVLYDSFFHSFYQSRNVIEKKHDVCVPFPIIHVYGSVGPLSLSDWYRNNQDYKQEYKYFKHIYDRCQGIKVIDEERSDTETQEKIRTLLRDYKRIFFLGFGYAPENLDAIDLLKNIDHTWQIFGTAKGMTPKEIRDIKNSLPVNRGTPYAVPGAGVIDPSAYATIEDRNCFDLLREYL